MSERRLPSDHTILEIAKKTYLALAQEQTEETEADSVTVQIDGRSISVEYSTGNGRKLSKEFLENRVKREIVNDLEELEKEQNDPSTLTEDQQQERQNTKKSQHELIKDKV